MGIRVVSRAPASRANRMPSCTLSLFTRPRAGPSSPSGRVQYTNPADRGLEQTVWKHAKLGHGWGIFYSCVADYWGHSFKAGGDDGVWVHRRCAAVDLDGTSGDSAGDCRDSLARADSQTTTVRRIVPGLRVRSSRHAPAMSGVWDGCFDCGSKSQCLGATDSAGTLKRGIISGHEALRAMGI